MDFKANFKVFWRKIRYFLDFKARLLDLAMWVCLSFKWWNPERDEGFPYWWGEVVRSHSGRFSLWAFGIFLTGFFLNYVFWALLSWPFNYFTVPAWGLAPWVVIRFKEEMFG